MLEIVDIRDATEEEIQEFTKKQEKPEWQQRMMDNFLRRPKLSSRLLRSGWQ